MMNRKRIENKMACPHCEGMIPWKDVSRFYGHTIGSKNHGRKSMDSAEGRRMVLIRWANARKAQANS